MSIQKRSIFFDNTDGIVRWWDWAKVTTTLGSMVEPFIVGSRHTPDSDFETLDPEDEINRVDDIRAMSIDKSQNVLSGGDQHLHGGYQLPRTGQ